MGEGLKGSDTRIVLDPSILSGKPVIRGTRISVEHLLALLAQGCSEEQIMTSYPGVTPADIRACRGYASMRRGAPGRRRVQS